MYSDVCLQVLLIIRINWLTHIQIFDHFILVLHLSISQIVF